MASNNTMNADAKQVLRARIEQAWRERANTQGYKPKSAAYRKAEIEFFAGAMQAIQSLDTEAKPDKLSSNVPVSWVINAISGRPIASA